VHAIEDARRRSGLAASVDAGKQTEHRFHRTDPAAAVGALGGVTFETAPRARREITLDVVR
jgi:hypothetical protein